MPARKRFSTESSRPCTCVLTLDSMFTTRSGPPTTGLKTVPTVRPMRKFVPLLWRTSARRTRSGRAAPRRPGCTAARAGSACALSMMLMPEAPAPGRMNPVNGFETSERTAGTGPCWVEEEHVARPHLDGQGAAVEAALERVISRVMRS